MLLSSVTGAKNRSGAPVLSVMKAMLLVELNMIIWQLNRLIRWWVWKIKVIDRMVILNGRLCSYGWATLLWNFSKPEVTNSKFPVLFASCCLQDSVPSFGRIDTLEMLEDAAGNFSLSFVNCEDLMSRGVTPSGHDEKLGKVLTPNGYHWLKTRSLFAKDPLTIALAYILLWPLARSTGPATAWTGISTSRISMM